MSRSALATLELQVASCRACADGLLHCHGTAVEHLTGLVDCLGEPSCRLIAEIHAFVLGCDAVDCDCTAAF